MHKADRAAGVGLRRQCPAIPTMEINLLPALALCLFLPSAVPLLKERHPSMQTISVFRTAATLLVAGTLAACSSNPPTEQMAIGRTTLQRVSAAPNVAADAPLELQMARDKWVRAEKAMSDKDYDLARRLSTEAAVDARLAETKADAAGNAKALGQMQGSIRALQEEINRRSPVR